MGDTVECVITGGQFDKSAEWQVIEISWKSFYHLYFWESRILIAIILSQLERVERRMIAKQAHMDVAGITIQVNWTMRLKAAQVKTLMQNTYTKWVFTERCICKRVIECPLVLLVCVIECPLVLPVWQGCYLVQGGILTRLHKVARICRSRYINLFNIYEGRRRWNTSLINTSAWEAVKKPEEKGKNIFWKYWEIEFGTHDKIRDDV